MAQNTYRHNNMILNVPNKRGATKKGLPIIHTDNTKPTEYSIQKIDDDNVRLTYKTYKPRAQQNIEENTEAFKSALIIARQYALEHQQNLSLENKNIYNISEPVIEKISVDNIQIPMTLSELQELSQTQKKFHIEAITENSGYSPQNTLTRTFLTLPTQTPLVVENTQQMVINGLARDEYYTSNIVDLTLKNESNPEANLNDYSHITLKTKIDGRELTLLLSSNDTNNLKLPKIEGYQTLSELYLEGDDILLSDTLKQIKKENPDTHIILKNISPNLIFNIFTKDKKYGHDTLYEKDIERLEHIKSLGVDLLDYLKDVKEFYGDNTPKPMSIISKIKDLDTDHIPEKKLKILHKINEHKEVDFETRCFG